MSAKQTVLVGLKVIALAFILSVFFVLGSVVSGVATTAEGAAPATAVDPGRFFLLLLAVSLLEAGVLAYVILRSRWAGWKLVGAVFIAFFGVNNLLSSIEAAAYLQTRLPAGMAPRLVVMGVFTAALFSPLAVLILGKMRRGAVAEAPNPRLAMPLAEWAWKAGAIAAAYLVLYYTFGYFVAWKNPAVQQFYGGTDPGSFFKQLASVWSATPWMFPFQVLRALLFMAFVLPVIRMLKGAAWETGLAVALLFSILGGAPLLLPNPLMPEAVARTHLVEVMSSNFIFGWVVGWLLSRSPAARREVAQRPEAKAA